MALVITTNEYIKEAVVIFENENISRQKELLKLLKLYAALPKLRAIDRKQKISRKKVSDDFIDQIVLSERKKHIRK